MKIEIASRKAVEYACINYHYSKTVPVYTVAHAVFNKKEFCGVILYGGGASANMGKPYNLNHGKYLELNRIALNGKQEITSKALSLSLKIIKAKHKTIELIISYSDKGQNHYGTIYQATNWYFVNDIKSSGKDVFYKGKWVHDRVPNELPKIARDKLKTRVRAGKYKYLYPMNKKQRMMCEKLSKQYPKKKSVEIESNVSSNLD